MGKKGSLTQTAKEIEINITRKLRFCMIRALFNEEVTSALLDGAFRACRELEIGLDRICSVDVAGAFELPNMARQAVRSGRFDAVLAFGCVIRGDTPHFDYICDQTARGLMEVSLNKSGVPVVFGVLTTNDESQARQRAGLDGSSLNVGYDAVHTAILSLGSLQRIRDEQ